MRGELTRENIDRIAEYAYAVVDANEAASETEPFATPAERAAFHALLHAIGEAVEDGYRAA